MTIQEIISHLWEDYVVNNLSVQKIYDLLINEGEKVENDHIAFRTFDIPGIDIDILSTHFLKLGYKECGQYNFDEKKLVAKHFEHKTDTTAPKIFISGLKVEFFSESLQKTVRKMVKKIPADLLYDADLIFAGRQWGTPSYKIYQELCDESEYAAWLYVFGFRVNHFTVLANALKKYNQLHDLNEFLRNNGIVLNTLGGEIKGSRSKMLEQSSTMADVIKVYFVEGIYEIPSCYYEFARRWEDETGKLFSGFIQKSADKIFESTDFYAK